MQKTKCGMCLSEENTKNIITLLQIMLHHYN